MKLNSIIAKDYFMKLKATLSEHDLLDKPGHIYNMDEKGCSLTIQYLQDVLPKTGSKQAHIILPEHVENVTIVACGNAIGQMIPPMILVKEKCHMDQWKGDLPPGSSVEMTERGSLTYATFIKWLEHFAKFKTPGKTLLIFDGAKSQLDANIMDSADDNDVILFCLPGNCTHELQPLDKVCFGVFEKYWDLAVLNTWTSRGDQIITPSQFGTIFKEVWLKSMTPANLVAGFRNTGIYPFNDNIVLDSALAPSEIAYDSSPEMNEEHEVTHSCSNDEDDPAFIYVSKDQILMNYYQQHQK